MVVQFLLLFEPATSWWLGYLMRCPCPAPGGKELEAQPLQQQLLSMPGIRRELATDLVRLSRLWEENKPLLEGDQKNFREEDGEGANADAAAIIQTLAHANEQEER